jgi:hypothetical protein
LREIQRADKKLWPFQTRKLISSDATSTRPSGDSTSTPRKTASGNSFKDLRAIQRSDKKLWPFQTRKLISSDATST